MTKQASPESRIDVYLARLRAALRGMPEGEIDDVLREIRSHITELSEAEGSDVEAAIRSLGDPVDLATKYRNENLMVQAECSGSALVILQALRHASRTRTGRVTATALYLFGYANVVTLWGAVIEKFLAPDRTGFWLETGVSWGARLIVNGDADPGSREILGWWLVPAALVGGWVIKYLIDHLAQAWLRRRRRSKESRAS
jgi:hypothetical protein